jgi:cadmium resistance protein CadD (predicted permease)
MAAVPGTWPGHAVRGAAQRGGGGLIGFYSGRVSHLAVVATAAVAFVATNTDDFVALLLLALGAGANRAAWARIIGGQYLGFGVLLLGAMAGAALFSLIDPDLVGLLGILPVVLGVRGLVLLVRRESRGAEPDAAVGGVFPVAVLTVANGSDNLSVYIPLYRNMTAGLGVVTTVVFLVMLGVLCVLALVLGRYARLIPGTVRVCRWATPFVYIAIGVTLLVRFATGSPGLL